MLHIVSTGFQSGKQARPTEIVQLLRCLLALGRIAIVEVDHQQIRVSGLHNDGKSVIDGF